MGSITKKVPIPKNGVDYRGKIVLAPMVRSGECPSRLAALKYGADLVWGPETVDKAMIGTTRIFNERTKTVDFSRLSSNGLKNPLLNPEQKESVIYRLHPEREGSRHIYQIGTANPETAVAAASLVAPDVAGIDVNAGCPKPFSTSGGMGAALLKTPERLCSILRALVKEVGEPNQIGISVKIRLLDTPEETKALGSLADARCRLWPCKPRRQEEIAPSLSTPIRQVQRPARAQSLGPSPWQHQVASQALPFQRFASDQLSAPFPCLVQVSRLRWFPLLILPILC